MTEKLHQYTQHIQTLEGENAKLYQDNCQLSSTVQLLNERVTHLSADQGSQLQQFITMQDRLHTLETERNNLVRNNQDILISTNNGTSHHLLGIELARMRIQTTRVLKDMSLLQAKYSRLVTAQHGQTSPGGVLSPLESVPQIDQSMIRTPSDIHQRLLSADGAPRLQPSRLPLQAVPQRSQQHIRAPQQQQVQHAPLQPLQHGQQAQAQRRSSLNPYPPQRLLPVTAGWTVPPPLSAPPMFGARSSTTDFAPPPISAPLNPSRPHQLHTLPLTYISQPAYRTASAPVLPLKKPDPAPLRLPPSLTIDLTESVPNERAAEHSATDGDIDQHSSLKRPSSAVDDVRVQDEVIKRQRTAEPTQTPQDDIVDEKSVLPEPKPASTTSPVQVGVSNDEVAIAATPSDTVVPSNPTSPVSAEPSPPTPLAAEKNMRSVEDCVYMIYESDAEIANAYFCGRCFDRYESKMLPEPPEVLTDPKFEDLFMHCTKEHPTIWEDFRYKRDMEVLPS
ncbi:hypothetical protein AZE42_00445 [Rhizopogon vesiculosus]|uniref:Uncharacterized protein n=1 Tax=Rhizopogon vesiculosus TaxID=180088 RepID=A0A1J8QFA0_9AGAM|nr:hypothetical protein AZE42_00445 [Rhizopogon vesiculosus]